MADHHWKPATDKQAQEVLETYRTTKVLPENVRITFNSPPFVFYRTEMTKADIERRRKAEAKADAERPATGAEAEAIVRDVTKG